LLTAEFIFIQAKTIGAANTMLTVLRGQLGTTATTHASGVIFEIVATPVPQGSDLGPDMSRSPIIKASLIQTWRRDVIIAGSLVALAKAGMVPGIPNQVAYQLHQRFWEALQDAERSLIKGLATPPGTQSEYQTMWGTLPWTGYSTPVPNSTSVLYNAAGAALTEILLNQPVLNIYLQGGGVPDAIFMNPIVLDRISRIFRDQIHVRQEEVVRGYTVDTIRTSLGTKPLKLIPSGYYPNPTLVEAVMTYIDLSRGAIIPFLNRFCFLISAPTTKDADIVSLIMQWTYEQRNTGTDIGYSSQTMRNFAT